jgi:hypothetical protein
MTGRHPTWSNLQHVKIPVGWSPRRAEAIRTAGFCHCRSTSISTEAAESRRRCQNSVGEQLHEFLLDLTIDFFHPRAANFWSLESPKHASRRLDTGSQSLEAQLIHGYSWHCSQDMTIQFIWKGKTSQWIQFWGCTIHVYERDTIYRWCLRAKKNLIMGIFGT